MIRHALAPLSCLALLAACTGGEEREPAPVSFQGTKPADRPSAPATPLTNAGPDARGVVYNDGYQTIIARNGDTVDTIAARVGITGAELAAYNGLPTTYRPVAGDELVLPAKPGDYRQTAVAAVQPQPAPTSTVPAPTAIETAPIGADPTPTANGSTVSPSGWSASSIAAAIDNTKPPAPADASVQPAAPAPAQAGTVTAPAATQAEPAPSVQAVAPAPAPKPEQVLQETVEQAPTPAVQSTQVAVAPAAPAAQLVRPVEAPIARRFSKLPGPNRNDGVDFASPAGAQVQAADAGTVALVSKSLGGLGTIVLIRHDDGLLTVYGRIDAVTVQKGDTVARGQTFARVADLPPPREPSLHFEVRRGAESVDPEDFI